MSDRNRPTQNIALQRLVVSPLNVRKHGTKAITDMMASIRSKGLLQSLLVRPLGKDFEVIAGGRRTMALKRLARDNDPAALTRIPCLIARDLDDAEAIAASLAENTDRVGMDEMDQYEAFARILATGKSPEFVAQQFDVSVTTVNRRMALASLIPAVRSRYRKGDIRPEALKLLTLATPTRQKDYIAALDAGSEPHGHDLKAWLLGGEAIPAGAAIFDSASYTGGYTSDLFDTDRCFADAGQFWTLQNAALADRREALLARGWTAVTILPKGERYAHWSHEKVNKRAGGHAFIEVADDGRVTEHLGYLPRAAAAKLARQSATTDAVTGEAIAEQRPELTAALASYIDLVRHGAVQTAVAHRPDVALRLVLAHILGGSALWRIEEHRPAANLGEATIDAVAAQPAAKAFAKLRATAIKTLGLDDDKLVQAPWSNSGTAVVFARLMELTDDKVMQLLAVAMAATLASSTNLIDTLGTLLSVTPQWTADDAFFDMLRDREVLDGMLADVVGTDPAKAYTAETGQKKKSVLRMALDGKSRPKATGWLPRWLTFPQAAYTARRLSAHAPSEA